MPLQIEKSADSAILNYTQPSTMIVDATSTSVAPSNRTTESSSSKTTSSTDFAQKLNDSLAVESIPETTKQPPESGATESSSVGSYFVENRNLPDFVLNDARYDIPAKTFLPPPIGSSTMQPPPSYHQPYQTYHQNPNSNPHPYDGRSYMDPSRSFGQQPNYQPNYQSNYQQPSQQYRTGYYQTQEQLRNSYYQEWNRSRPNDYSMMGGQNYVADPNTFERRTVYALPPIQLPPAVAPRPPTTFSRNTYNRNQYEGIANCSSANNVYSHCVALMLIDTPYEVAKGLRLITTAIF